MRARMACWTAIRYRFWNPENDGGGTVNPIPSGNGDCVSTYRLLLFLAIGTAGTIHYKYLLRCSSHHHSRVPSLEKNNISLPDRLGQQIYMLPLELYIATRYRRSRTCHRSVRYFSRKNPLPISIEATLWYMILSSPAIALLHYDTHPPHFLNSGLWHIQHQ